MSRVPVAQPGPLRRALIFGEMAERKEGRGKGKGKKKDRGSRGKPVTSEGDPSPGECQPLGCSQAGALPGPMRPRAAPSEPGPLPTLPCGGHLHLAPALCAHREPGRPARALSGPPGAALSGRALGPRVGSGAKPGSAAPGA